MKYYEIWFYYYGENDEKTDFNKEFTFYIKMDREIKDKIDLINELKKRMYNNHNQNDAKEYRYWLEGHLENLSNWFEISSNEFFDGCGIEA